MPLLLSTPQIRNTTIDRQQIISFSVDASAGRLYIVYAEGNADGGTFIQIGDFKQADIEPAEFQGALAQHANPDLYSDIKTLLYMLLAAKTGSVGTVE